MVVLRDALAHLRDSQMSVRDLYASLETDLQQSWSTRQESQNKGEEMDVLRGFGSRAAGKEVGEERDRKLDQLVE